MKADFFDRASDENVRFLERIYEKGIERQEQSYQMLKERIQKLTNWLTVGSWLFWFLLFMEVPLPEMIVRAFILSGRDFLFPVIERSVS